MEYNYIYIYSQWRVQEFVRGGGQKTRKAFFFAFQFFQGGPAQEIGEKIIFPTKKINFYGGGGGARAPGPPLDTRLIVN